MSASTAGYSGTPLVRKLGVKPDARLGLIGAPEGFDGTLGELPPGVRVRRRLGGQPFDVILAFHTRPADLERRLPALVAALDPAGGLWLAWPKRACGMATDVTEDVVRSRGLAAGLVDKQDLRDRPGVVGASFRLPAARPAYPTMIVSGVERRGVR